MSGLDNMRTRIGYMGGDRQVDRMNEDKLRTLKKALLYSYQSATAILADGREFRCLINPDMLKNQYDNKILSIPFEDICLNADRVGKTTEGYQIIGVKPGDVITWKENGTDWLIYLREYSETAYFRAELRRCKYTVDVYGTEYKIYAARASVNEIDWRLKQQENWTDLDYTLEVYITKDEKTLEYFHRYTVVEINGKPWEVQAVDSMSSDGIIIMYLKETFTNTLEKEVQKEMEELNKDKVENPWPDDITEPFIYGRDHMYPYETSKYVIVNDTDGKWELGSDKGELQNTTDIDTDVFIKTGRSGSLQLRYIRTNGEIVTFNITIDSL